MSDELSPSYTRDTQIEALEADIAAAHAKMDQLQQALAGLVEECRYSISSGLPIMTTWTQYRRASDMLLAIQINETGRKSRDPQIG
jgi:hypothetical protein